MFINLRQSNSLAEYFLKLSFIFFDLTFEYSYVREVAYYHKSLIELSYSISAEIADLIANSLLFVSLAEVVDCSALVF